MQRIEFVGTEEVANYGKAVDLRLLDESELITSPDEIEGIIRRAITILWKGRAFTYNELAAHLTRNYVVLPKSIEERDGLFEEVIQKVWHTQKELARVALTPLPTRLRYYNAEAEQTYHGVIVPFSFEAIKIEPAPVQEEKVYTQVIKEDEPVLGSVIEFNERKPGLDVIEIAKRIFESLTNSKTNETVLGIQKIKTSIMKERPATSESDIEFVLREMVENGYITLRRTGKNKDTRWNAVMSRDTKQDVLSDVEDGTFEEGLTYIFGRSTSVAL